MRSDPGHIRDMDELLNFYQGNFGDLGIYCDRELLRKVTECCGDSILDKDTSLVSVSDSSEVESLKEEFLISQLGCSDPDQMNSAIGKVTDQFGGLNRHKYRAVFYYLLVKVLCKESLFR